MLLRSKDNILFRLILLAKFLLTGKKAIVIRRMGAIGDVICTLPLCVELKKQNPDKLIVFITGHSIRQLVSMSQSCDLVFGACEGDFDVTEGFLGLVDKVYHPQTSDERGEGGKKYHLVNIMAHSCGMHLVDQQPRLYPSADDKKRAINRYGLTSFLTNKKLLICVNLGPSWPVRNWPREKWQEVVDWIHQNYDATVLQIGYGGDGFVPLNAVKSLVGVGSIAEMVSMISLCNLVISIDSGPIHVAGAVGTPVIGLYGALSPENFLPPASEGVGVYAEVPCLFCHHESPIGHWRTGCPHDIRCMKELSVEKVCLAVKMSLGSNNMSYGLKT